MKIAIVGSGGLGGYFGGRLARGGEDVSFLARGPALEAMKTTGLIVESVLGDFALDADRIQATADPSEIGPAEIVLVTVKAYDTETVAETILPAILGPDTVVISLQNGIDNEDRIAARVGVEHVAGGVAYIFAGVARPGVVRHTGGPARLVVGELDGHQSTRLASGIVQAQAAAFSDARA